MRAAARYRTLLYAWFLVGLYWLDRGWPIGSESSPVGSFKLHMYPSYYVDFILDFRLLFTAINLATLKNRPGKLKG